MTTMERPAAHEHLPYYTKYIALVGEPDVLSLLERQPGELRALAASVPPQLETYRYAPEKWSVRQVFGHLNDAERVFGYRAFRISRGDQTPLAGFDENTYAAQGQHDEVPLAELAEEFAQLRAANLAVLKRLDGSRAARMGTANNAAISVRALAYIMAGHVRHHQQGLSANYGVGALA